MKNLDLNQEIKFSKIGRIKKWKNGEVINKKMVGVTGLEPVASCAPCKRASQLRYTPTANLIILYYNLIVNIRRID